MEVLADIDCFKEGDTVAGTDEEVIIDGNAVSDSETSTIIVDVTSSVDEAELELIDAAALDDGVEENELNDTGADDADKLELTDVTVELEVTEPELVDAVAVVDEDELTDDGAVEVDELVDAKGVDAETTKLEPCGTTVVEVDDIVMLAAAALEADNIEDGSTCGDAGMGTIVLGSCAGTAPVPSCLFCMDGSTTHLLC